MVKKQSAKENKFEKDSGGATLLNGKIYRIPATKDFIFKNLFGVNGKEKNLKGLLEVILKIKIQSLEIQNPELPKKYEKAKKGILDVRAKLKNGTSILIEMQVQDQNNLGERITFYLCTLYISTIESGENYDTIDKTIAIAIINFSYFNRKEYHQIAHLKFEKCEDTNEIAGKIKGEESKIITDKLELHIIDLEKFRKIKNPKGELAQWLNLIIGNEEEIEMAVKTNKLLEKVNKENKLLSSDKFLQEEYWLEKKALYDYNTDISVATRKGKEEGIKEGIEKGREEGIKEGIAEGREKGIKEGSDKQKVQIAKKMLDMKFNIKDIEEATGLKKEEIYDKI